MKFHIHCASLMGPGDVRVNPASGLPIIGDSMFDVGGNPYGIGSSDDWSTGLGMDWSSDADMGSGDWGFGDDW